MRKDTPSFTPQPSCAPHAVFLLFHPLPFFFHDSTFPLLFFFLLFFSCVFSMEEKYNCFE